jgi:hypothetical protein
MQIADRIPADMNALLSIFRGQNIPPVLRRRAAELLGVIKAAVKTAETVVPQDQLSEASSVNDQAPTRMEVETPAQTSQSSAPDLWNLGIVACFWILIFGMKFRELNRESRFRTSIVIITWYQVFLKIWLTSWCQRVPYSTQLAFE